MEKLTRSGNMAMEAGVLYLSNNKGEKYATHQLIASFWRVCDGLTDFKDLVRTVQAMNDFMHIETATLSSMLFQSILDLKKKGLMI